MDGEARFCPTCGTVLGEDAEPAEPAELPPAPAWPDREAPPEPELEPEEPEKQLTLEPDEPVEAAPDSAPPEPEPEPAPPPATAPTQAPGMDLPITWPTTLSGWLIGVGSVLGALALLVSLSDGVSLLLFVALGGVAATVFLADRLPEIPRLRLLTLSISLVGLGIAFERAGFGARGADSILLVAMIAAAGGALLVELDRDRPLPPPAS